MVIEIMKLPIARDGIKAIEEKYCEILNRYRNGEKLKPELIDWMDTADFWLMKAKK